MPVDADGGASGALHPGGGRRPQDLIHTSKSPKRASMRVPGRLTLENYTVGEVSEIIDFLNTPVGRLLLERRANGTKSTG